MPERVMRPDELARLCREADLAKERWKSLQLLYNQEQLKARRQESANKEDPGRP